MIDLLAVASEQVNGAFRPVSMTFLRIAAAMAVLPAFGEQSIPMRFRLALSLAFTAIVAPAVSEKHGGTDNLLPALGETLAGLIIGLALRLLILALQTAASIAAQSASLSQLFASAGAEPMPALGTLLTLAAIALAVQADLHVQLAALFILSYEMLPAGQIPAGSEVASWGVAQVSAAMSLAFSLAAPFVAAALIWNVALGVVNRAMPHLMLAFIGAPALAWGGLVLTALSVPLVLSVWLSAFNAIVADPFSGD